MNPLSVLVVLLLILANALYVAAEFAAVSVRRGQVRERATGGNRLAKRLLHIVEDSPTLDRYIATCQVGITLSSLLLGAFGQIAFTPSLAGFLAETFVWRLPFAFTVAASIVLVALTGFQVVFGELVPKSLALQFPTQSALATVLPTSWSMRGFAPFIWVLNGSALSLLRIFRLPEKSHHHVHSPEEIELLATESREGGLLEPEEHRMLSGALHLHARPAHQLMVPRPQMVAIDVDTSVDETMATLARSSFTRIPVFKGDPANVIGIVHAKDAALRLFSERPAASTRDLLRPIPMVPETLPGDRVLQALRDARAQMAIVQDEHGTAVGIITFEDVLAEMLGGGAARPPRAELVVEPLGEGKARLPGLLPIARAPPWLPIPDGSEAHTVAGLVLEHAGGIPRVGDVIVLGGLRLSIERMTGRRVDSVIVEGLPHDEDPGSAPGGDARG